MKLSIIYLIGIIGNICNAIMAMWIKFSFKDDLIFYNISIILSFGSYGILFSLIPLYVRQRKIEKALIKRKKWRESEFDENKIKETRDQEFPK